MKSFPAGLTIRLTLPLIDLNGDPVTPTGLSFMVSDLDGIDVVARTNLDFAAGDTDAEVTIDSAFNELEPGAAGGGRTVHLFIKSADGVHVQEETYGLRGFQRLLPPVNSFLTDAAAQVLAADIPGLDGFLAAEATARQAALIEAHHRITRLTLQAEPAHERPLCRPITQAVWSGMDAAGFKTLPVAFRKALFRAQLRQADAFLSFDPIRAKRRAGVLSETIGESSMMFRSGKPVDGPIVAEALSELTGHIVSGARVVRA